MLLKTGHYSHVLVLILELLQQNPTNYSIMFDLKYVLGP